jgi:hypothetical protein
VVVVFESPNKASTFCNCAADSYVSSSPFDGVVELAFAEAFRRSSRFVSGLLAVVLVDPSVAPKIAFTVSN